MFYVELSVRDYECDQQGIVNNSVYLNYLQHARHEFGRSVGMDWLDLTSKGTNLVLRKVELNYYRSLYPGDRIRITARPYRKGMYRLYFDQEILLLPDELPVLKARLNIACVIDGKPAAPDDIDVWFGAIESNKELGTSKK